MKNTPSKTSSHISSVVGKPSNVAKGRGLKKAAKVNTRPKQKGLAKPVC